MPFDEKEFELLSDIESLRSEPRGFAPEQMVTCEVCLRANSPTRTSCLYCTAQLPTTQINATLQKPTLRKLEQWEQGFNIIFRPGNAGELTQESLGEIGGLLRLKPEELKRIVEAGEPLPLARATTREEASLVERSLAEMGVSALVIADSDLLSDDPMPKRVRAFEFTENEIVASAAGSRETWRASWNEIALLVAGRLLVRQIEVEEHQGRKAEREMVDAREMSADESVLDIYCAQNNGGWRITAGKFDFSCLGSHKGLIATQNFSTLIKILRERAGTALYDDAYYRVRHALGIVWPLEQQTEARGWRRARIGRVNTEAVTKSDNEQQFTRYSRLRYYLKVHHPESIA